jgi:hypothetical protein
VQAGRSRRRVQSPVANYPCPKLKKPPIIPDQSSIQQITAWERNTRNRRRHTDKSTLYSPAPKHKAGVIRSHQQWATAYIANSGKRINDSGADYRANICHDQIYLGHHTTQHNTTSDGKGHHRRAARWPKRSTSQHPIRTQACGHWTTSAACRQSIVAAMNRHHSAL